MNYIDTIENRTKEYFEDAETSHQRLLEVANSFASLYRKNIYKENIVELLEKIDSEYTGLLEFSSKKMRISGNHENELILKALKDNGYISSFKREKANLAVYRKQK